MNSRIVATGSYLPQRILSNADLETLVETNDEWIVSRTGIKQRHIAAEGEKTSDLAYAAVQNLVKSSGFDLSLIDMIIVGTSSPDMVFPATACLLQAKLGLNHIPAFDIIAACSGFVYTMSVADSMIKNKQAKNVLVIGADTVSRFIDYTDRNTCILFGDGAGAVILSATEEEGVIASSLFADGTGASILKSEGHIYNGKIEGLPYITMDGQAVFKFAVKSLVSAAHDVLAKSQYTAQDIDWFIPHQANMRIIESTAHMLHIPMDKVIVTVDQHGNTSAASVPLALDHGVKSGKIKKGDLVLLEGVGGGFTWGANLVRF